MIDHFNKTKQKENFKKKTNFIFDSCLQFYLLPSVSL